SCEFADACGKAAPAPPAADPIIPAFLESHGGYQFQPQQQQQSYGQQPQQQQSPPSIPVAPVAPIEQQPVPLTSNIDCSRQPDGFYEQGQCQQNYVRCANGLTFAQQCQAGLVFRIDRCEFPADCANPPQPIAAAPEAPAQSDLSITIVTTRTEASCASLTDGNHPVDDCSQEYSSCWGGAGVRAKCPGSLFYNPENNFCDHRENVAGCNNLAIQEDAPAFSCGTKPAGFYGSGCSGTYFHCDGGISITLACPSGLLFSEATQRCDHRESVTECGGNAPSPIAPSPEVQSPPAIPPASQAPLQQQYGAAPQQPLQQSPPAYPQQWQSVNAQAQPQPIVSPPQQYSQQGRRRSRARA
ncbi:Chitin binding Peritrophin-A domain containing protein, partial [Aphelenchoides avenae]